MALVRDRPRDIRLIRTLSHAPNSRNMCKGSSFSAQSISPFSLRTRTGGPLKPGFGLSGAVRQLDKVFPPLVRVFAPSIPTRSRPVPHSRLRSGENCSTPSPPDVRTTQPSPDCDECNAAFPQTAGDLEYLNRSTAFARNVVPHS